MIDLLRYLSAMRRIMNARIMIVKLWFCLVMGFITGDVIISMMFGTFMNDIFSPNCEARKREVFEKNWKKNSKGNIIATKSAL